MNILRTAAAAALTLLAACQPAAQDTAADEAAMSQGTASWLSAYNAGDADTITALYVDDAVVTAPGRPAAVGREAIRAMVAADIEGARASGVTLQLVGPDAGGVAGDFGWHGGAYAVVDANGTAVDSGHYLEVWRKSDGQWRIVRDIWNSDRPPPAPEAAAEEPAAS